MAKRKEFLLGNEAIVKGACEAGVNFVTGYPGCPAAEIGDIFSKISDEKGVYSEWSLNEKTALESAIGASFSGLRSLVHMKSFGINVCADALFPLSYTGVMGGMVIVVADDPSCYSSAQSEQDSRGYAFLSHLPFLEPSDPQECYDFIRLAFEISEKFRIPIVIRTTTRVAHQRAVVLLEEKNHSLAKKIGFFKKNPNQFLTMPPRVLEMKRELFKKIEKVSLYAEKSSINKIINNQKSEIGAITTGVSFLYLQEALKELKLKIPILKLGIFYPLPQRLIVEFLKNKKKVLIGEEIEGYLEKEINCLAKKANLKVEIYGKNVLPSIGELSADLFSLVLAEILNKKYKKIKIKNIKLPSRSPRLCQGCPYWQPFSILKKIIQENPTEIVVGGDIGCNMLGAFSPHLIYDYMFCMSASGGVAHGIKKSTNQKVIAVMGDGTFFHSGLNALINSVYNNSSILFLILDNRTTAMTGHQPNPGSGKLIEEGKLQEIRIAEIVKACGVNNIKILDPIYIDELEKTIREFLLKQETSVIVCRRMCALLAKKQKQ